MSIASWFVTSFKQHHHIWGPWVKIDSQNIKYTHRMIQGRTYTVKRTCLTCGEENHQYKEVKLDI
jgi:hypothetical protein